MCLRSLLQQSVLKFRELDISECGVTSEGAVQLARGLTGNQWLTILDMFGQQYRRHWSSCFRGHAQVQYFTAGTLHRIGVVSPHKVLLR